LILHNCIYGADINPLAVELAKFSLWMFSATKDNELEPLSDQLFQKDSLTDLQGWKALTKEGHFSAVVGNPPYVRQQEHFAYKKDSISGFKVFHGMADLYSYFIELGHTLVGNGGRVGLIVANKWMRADYGKPLRAWIVKAGLQQLVDFGDLPVFKGIAAYPCIVFLEKGSTAKTFDYCGMDQLNPATLNKDVDSLRAKVKISSLR
jgi:hypothetical protein